jgi:hypothetical protein
MTKVNYVAGCRRRYEGDKKADPISYARMRPAIGLALPSRSTPGIFRKVPADDLLDQFLAEPPGQGARAQ